ncbi:MAG: ferritin-like domain-containing protein [Alphaproteobacteria bacterium]
MPEAATSPVPAGAPSWELARRGRIAVGSPAHRELFCRMLLDTFDPYKPAIIDWPKLSGEELGRLTGLPFWSLAVRTEGLTARRMQSFADTIEDPLIREAVALNAFEELRHKEVLHDMIRFYGIEIDPEPEYAPPKNPRAAFIQTGYGECFDSFFAFGLFKLARDSGFFTPALVEVFEPVIQEEARHILFFINWLRYVQKNRNIVARPAIAARRVAAVASKLANRLSLARGSGGANNAQMTREGHKAMGIKLTPRGFLEVCLAENARRLGAYDRRLLRPLVIPRLVRLAMPMLKR